MLDRFYRNYPIFIAYQNLMAADKLLPLTLNLSKFMWHSMMALPVCWGTESQIWFSASDCSRWIWKDLTPHATYSECCPPEGPCCRSWTRRRRWWRWRRWNTGSTSGARRAARRRRTCGTWPCRRETWSRRCPTWELGSAGCLGASDWSRPSWRRPFCRGSIWHSLSAGTRSNVRSIPGREEQVVSKVNIN